MVSFVVLFKIQKVRLNIMFIFRKAAGSFSIGIFKIVCKMKECSTPIPFWAVNLYLGLKIFLQISLYSSWVFVFLHALKTICCRSCFIFTGIDPVVAVVITRWPNWTTHSKTHLQKNKQKKQTIKCCLLLTHRRHFIILSRNIYNRNL
jgi:hypothetical protein